MSKVSQKTGVLFLRLDRRTVDRIGELCELTGKSRNEFGALAVDEAVAVLSQVLSLRSNNAGPDAYIDAIGPSWLNRLLCNGLGDPIMEIAWREFLREQAADRREVSESRRRRGRKSNG